MALSPDPATPINFIIDNFETAITLDVSGNLFKSLVTMDVSGVADLYVDLSLVRSAFQIQTDASDVINASSSDIKYFINRDIFWNYDTSHSFAINPADAIYNFADSSVNIMNATDTPQKNMVCHDFVRFIASKLFNTPYGTDLFQNELELLNDIRDNSQKVWFTIDKELAKYDVVDRPALSSVVGYDGVNFESQVLHDGTYSGWKWYSNDVSGNISKKMLDQMAYNNPARLRNIANTTEIQPIPFVENDTISLKLTVNPADGQETLTGVPPLGARTYRIRYKLKDGHSPSHTLDVSRDVDENLLYREYVVPF
jgi:hypothetical protein